MRYIDDTGTCLLLNESFTDVTNNTAASIDTGFYRLKNETKPNFVQGAEAIEPEVWCVLEEGATSTRLGIPAASIPDAVQGGLVHDSIVGNHFVYANQVHIRIILVAQHTQHPCCPK